ncbi:HU family DNA-binding protein [Fusobacterium polymorphum]|jgi:DNA-binding protein HU|uniref:HU family DNA-binding protein n=1 Tax=Fusobacterium nucleatum subsp. polymorphum TaxID=76857 RepID=UPI0030D5AB3B
MLKKELLNVLSEKLGIKKIETEKFLDTLEEIITEELKKGEDFTLGKLGTFKVKDRAEKNGVNPKTGEKIVIPARKAVTFKASKNLSTLIK